MQNIYRYNMYLQYQYDDALVVIDNTNIISATIDYDYDNKNMPIIVLIASIDSKIVDHMLTNTEKKIVLNISKYNKSSDVMISENYIYKEFTYFISANVSNTDDIDYTKDSNLDKHRKITIGLMDQELLDNNKVLINEIANNTTLINLLANHLSHMRLLIEPVRDVKIDSLLIPATTTISNFVKFVNSNYSLYNSNYRLFYDFDKTYLLSYSGKPVEAEGEDINSIIINVNTNTDRNNGLQGMRTDYKNKTHIIDVSINDISYLDNESDFRSYDTIISVDSMGNTSKSSINSTFNNNVKVVYSNDDNHANKIQNRISNQSFMITIPKTDIDSSEITINKQYSIKNYSKLKDKDGTFILARKKEVYTRDGDEYILTCILSFKKAIS